ncbi:unnamed protein product [Rhizopus stolonifer]
MAPATPDTNAINQSTTNTQSRSSTLNIGSLNYRSLSKISSPQSRQSFIRYLRSQAYDILTLQETHAEDQKIQDTLNILFNTNSAHWTKHCGIVCLNPSISITPILVTIDQQLLVCEKFHQQQLFESFTVITIYAPAQPIPNRVFFKNILQLPIFGSHPIENTAHSTSPIYLHRVVLTGDFNYDLNKGITGYQKDWNEYVQLHYFNCLDSAHILRTFQRGSSSSTIYYIYISPVLHSSLISSQVESPTHGKGIWKANPQLAKNEFLFHLSTMRSTNFASHSLIPAT